MHSESGYKCVEAMLMYSPFSRRWIYTSEKNSVDTPTKSNWRHFITSLPKGRMRMNITNTFQPSQREFTKVRLTLIWKRSSIPLFMQKLDSNRQVLTVQKSWAHLSLLPDHTEQANTSQADIQSWL